MNKNECQVGYNDPRFDVNIRLESDVIPGLDSKTKENLEQLLRGFALLVITTVKDETALKQAGCSLPTALDIIKQTLGDVASKIYSIAEHGRSKLN